MSGQRLLFVRGISPTQLPATLASERVAEDSRVQYYNHLRSLYRQVVGLQPSVALYTSSQYSLPTHSYLT